MAYALAALMGVLGAVAIVFGGYDDSPGLQGIGLLLVIGSVAVVVRQRRAGKRVEVSGV